MLLPIILILWLRLGPLPEGFLDPSERVSTLVVDRHGVTLYEALSSDGTRSEWIGADSLSEPLIAATIAAEDRRFFSHPGVDPIAVARAALRNLRAGRIAEGGSTITQQVARQALRSPDRSLTTKVREAVLALRLEHRYSKREILALYLNVAPYGNQLVGVFAASRGYFGVPPSNLTLAQAAMLSAIPQSPTRCNPVANPGEAKRRQIRLLERISSFRLAGADAVADARREQIAIRRDSGVLVAPHFVQQLLEAKGPERAVRIETTLDASLQRDVGGIIDFHRTHLARHGASAVAVVVLDNATGEWLAWEGSGNYFDAAHGGAIDGVVTPRQPGSALKPFTYAVAFERGETPATLLPDIPSHFPTAAEGILYAPRNYDGVFRGPMRARMALAGSENVPAVALLDRLGPSHLAAFLRSAGFSTLGKTSAHYGLGLTLGDAEVRLDELVAAYAMLARGGVGLKPKGIARVVWVEGAKGPRGGAGQTPSVLSPQSSVLSMSPRLLSHRTAFWVTDILSDSRAREFIFGAGSPLEFPFPVAVKTGTSQAYRDNWTIGYTREVTVGVWVGNFDRSELRNSSGVTGAAPIFHAVMLAAQKYARGNDGLSPERPIVDPDPALRRVEICALSGRAAGRACPNREREWLGREALAVCDWHGGDQIRWPEEYQTWARASGQHSGGREDTRRDEKRFHIESPVGGAIYLIDPTLRREFQALPLRAGGTSNSESVRWTVDGRTIGTRSGKSELDWPLMAGEHEIVAESGGRKATVKVVVK